MASDPTFAETRTPPPPAAPGAPTTPGVALPALLLAALALAALLLARRRRVLAPTRLVEVLETASLGPRRALVVARVHDELLVLGSSEAGIALLSTRPAPPSLRSAVPAPSPASPPSPVAAPAALSAAAALVGRVLPRRVRAPAAAGDARFQAALTESLEDQELRRKLAGGAPGVIR